MSDIIIADIVAIGGFIPPTRIPLSVTHSFLWKKWNALRAVDINIALKYDVVTIINRSDDLHQEISTDFINLVIQRRKRKFD